MRREMRRWIAARRRPGKGRGAVPLAWLALLCTAGLATPVARASTPPLLCERDEVLRIVNRTVRGWNVYNRIVDGTAVESPTDTANAVICHATMAGVSYAQTPEGWVSRPYRERRRYDVQVIGNRLFVQVLP